MHNTRLHASLRRGTTPTCDAGTGEIRVPLAQFSLDEYAGDLDLVLSRGEADALFAYLRALVVTEPPARMKRPEAVR